MKLSWTNRMSSPLRIRLLVLFLMSCVGTTRRGAAQQTSSYVPHIVNGQITSAYPSTGLFLAFDDTAATSLYGLCSGTLVGCQTFVTAAHCVCPDSTTDASGCLLLGLQDPATIRIFLPNAGLFEVSSVSIAPNYDFAVHGDVAVVKLAKRVTGIAPTALNTTKRVDPGAQVKIVGYGTTKGGRFSADDSGIKREGVVSTSTCPSDIPDDQHVCWQFDGQGSNGCSGDSGGPLFVDFGTGPLLAGITSGGNTSDCLPPDIGFDTDVFVNRSWIQDTAGSDLTTQSCDLAAVGSGGVTTTSTTGQFTTASSGASLSVDVPAGTSLLRVALNGQLGFGTRPGSDSNDFDLFLRYGNQPTAQTFDCADTNPTTFGFCEIAAPQAGTWHVLVRRNSGAGAYQVTTTQFNQSTVAACTGDCNGDGQVTVDELLTGVSIALGADAALCPSFTVGVDGSVSIDQLIMAVGFALNQCPVR